MSSRQTCDSRQPKDNGTNLIDQFSNGIQSTDHRIRHDNPLDVNRMLISHGDGASDSPATGPVHHATSHIRQEPLNTSARFPRPHDWQSQAVVSTSQSPVDGGKTQNSAQRPADPRKRRPTATEHSRIPMEQNDYNVESEEQAQFAQDLKEAIVAINSKRQVKDKMALVQQRIAAIRVEQHQVAKSFPHKTFNDQLQSSLSKHEQELSKFKDELEKASGKEKHYTMSLVRRMLGLVMGGQSGSKNATDADATVQDLQVQVLSLQDQLRTLRDRPNVPDDANQAIVDLEKRFEAKFIAQEVQLRQLLELDSDRTRTAALIDDRFHKLGAELQSLRSAIHQIQASVRPPPEDYLKPSDLDVYIARFEDYKNDTKRWIDSIDTKSLSSRLDDLDREYGTSKATWEDVTESVRRFTTSWSTAATKNVQRFDAIDLRIKALSEQASSFLVQSQQMPQLFQQVDTLRQVVSRNDHAIVGLNHRWNSLTTEQLYKDITKTIFPSIASFQSEVSRIDNQYRTLHKELAQIAMQQEKLTLDFERKENELRSDAKIVELQSSFGELQSAFAALAPEKCEAHDQLQGAHRNLEAKTDALKVEVSMSLADQTRTMIKFSQELEEFRRMLSQAQKKLEDFQIEIRTITQKVAESGEICSSNNAKLITDVKLAKSVIDGRLDTIESKHVKYQQNGERVPAAASSIQSNLTSASRSDNRMAQASDIEQIVNEDVDMDDDTIVVGGPPAAKTTDQVKKSKTTSKHLASTKDTFYDDDDDDDDDDDHEDEEGPGHDTAAVSARKLTEMHQKWRARKDVSTRRPDDLKSGSATAVTPLSKRKHTVSDVNARDSVSNTERYKAVKKQRKKDK